MNRKYVSCAALIVLVGAAPVKDKWLSLAPLTVHAAAARSLPMFEVDRA